jgi:hypothetical protein
MAQGLVASAMVFTLVGCEGALFGRGGKRIVRAVITRRATAQAILCSLGLAPAPTRASAQSPPQLHRLAHHPPDSGGLFVLSFYTRSISC